MKRLAFFGLLALGIGAMHAAAAAEDVSRPDRAALTVARVERAAVALAREGLSSPAAAAQLQNLQQSIDFEAFAQATLGAHWSSASDSERQEFLRVLRDLLVNEIVRRAARRDPGSLEYLSHRSLANGDQLLSTRRVSSNDRATIVDWRLRRAGSTLRIVDIVVDGWSVMASARQDFAGQLNLNGGSVAVLTATLRDRLLRPF